MIHIFLLGQNPLHVINKFIYRGQQKFTQEFALSLRSLCVEKGLHIGSFNTVSNSQVELKSRPPNLIKLTLRLVLTEQFLTLHVSLDEDEVLYHNILPTTDLKLHHKTLEVRRNNRLLDREVNSDVQHIRPSNIVLYNRQENVQHLFDMGFNLVSDICYLSAQSMKLTEFEVNTQESLKDTPLIDDLLSSQNKQTQLFTDSATMTFSPVLPAPRPNFVRPTIHPPTHKISVSARGETYSSKRHS